MLEDILISHNVVFSFHSKLPFVNYWNAYCKRIDAAQPFSGQPSPGETMKIYMLMVLIGTIAAMSHLDFKRKSPGRGA
jgi:hypothetical protein